MLLIIVCDPECKDVCGACEAGKTRSWRCGYGKRWKLKAVSGGTAPGPEKSEKAVSHSTRGVLTQEAVWQRRIMFARKSS